MHAIKFVSLSALALGTLLACNRQKTAENTAPPAAATTENTIQLTPEQAKLADVQTGAPEMRTLAIAIECSGLVDVPPQNMIAIHAPIKGFVKDVSQLPGTYIKKGQRLTAISHPDLVRLQREFFENLSQLDMLEKEFKRKQALASGEATSQRALEQAKAEYDLVRARHQGLKAELKLIGIDVAKLESTKTIQEEVMLFSPINGYVDKVNINPGKLVNAEDLLYQVLDVSHVHAELKVFARDIALLKEGQRIEVRVPGKTTTYPAEIHLLSRMVDPENKTITVHGHFKPEPQQLLPGTFIQARVFTEDQSRLSVPETAVVREGDLAYVFVKKGTGFVKTPVRAGRTDGQFVAVDDLPVDVTIALTGAYYLNGMLANSAEEE